MLRDLRPHQQQAMDMLRASIAGGRVAPVLQAPCGFGKTVVAAHVVEGLRSRLKRVCFCVPTIDLVDQTMDRFAENGIDRADMGALQGNHAWRRPHAPIQVATGQTLTRRVLPDVDVVIIDEAHRRFEVYDRWMDEARARHDPSLARKLQRPFFIGLTATPWAKGMGKRYDDLIKVTPMADLIEQGYLSPFKVYAPTHVDLGGVATVKGDYHEGQLAERMNKAELVADVVTTWLRLGEGRPTLCFAVNRAHAKALHDRFEEAGVPVAYVDAKTPREERAEIGRQLEAGTIKVVCNIGCLTTGIDWDVRCLILARPTKSEALFVQIIGRALRTATGKDHAIILDHSDTHLRLGMVTDIDHDELDMGKPPSKADREAKEKSLPLPKECLACGGLIPAMALECPCCGATRPKPIFMEADGELSEMGAGGARKPQQKTSDILRQRDKRVVYAQLKYIQEERGRSDGWTAHAYRELFEVWPRGMDGITPHEPDGLLRAYVRAKDIRYAKSVAAKKTGEAAHG